MDLSIVEEHADEAAFVWELRDAASTAAHWDRAGLAGMDERVEAHLDGLRVAGAAGREAADERVGDERGTFFVATALAAEAGDLRRIAALLDAAADTHPFERALVGALAWIDGERAWYAVEPMLSAQHAALRGIGIAACTAHRRDPGPALLRALLDSDATLQQRALRAAGKLGRVDLRGEVHEALSAADPACRLEAGLAAALLGDDVASQALWTIADSISPGAERAITAAVTCRPPADAAWRLETMSGWPEKQRTAIAGAAALGDPAALSWLLDLLADPEHGRYAGLAVSWITGARIEGALAGTAPEGAASGPSDDPADDDVAMSADEHLPWPAPAALRAFCELGRATLSPGRRHILGRPRDQAALEDVVSTGSQRHRAIAAFELAASNPGASMIETRARADRGSRRG